MTETRAAVAAGDLHPWNESFTWTMPPGPYRALSEDQASAFDADGFIVLDDVIDAATLDAVEAELDGFEAETEAFLRQQESERLSIAEAGAITFTTHLVARSDIARRFSQLPLFVDLCADLVGPDVR